MLPGKSADIIKDTDVSAVFGAAKWPSGKMSAHAAIGAPLGSAWAVTASAKSRTAAERSFMTQLGVWEFSVEI